MKLTRILVIAAMVGTLSLMGCGSDDGGGTGGSGGTAGSGGSMGEGCADADVICANCAEGRPLNDCRADVFACNQIDERDLCEACILESEPGC